jgi:hypothetical protein
MVFEKCRRGGTARRPANVSIVVDRNKSDGGLRECRMMFEGEGQNCPSEGFDVFLLYSFWDRADRNAESVTGC